MKQYRQLFILCLLFLARLPGIYSQNLKLPITNYTNQAYGRIYDVTNRCVLIDHRNFVYAGNANGILEYDGGQWRFIPVRQGAYVTSMALSPSGRIYVGSQNEFGMLAANEQGELQYHSLSERLEESDRFFTTIWNTMADDQQVVFQSEESIFLFRGDSLRVIYPGTSFHTAFLVEGRLFARERGRGLLILEENGLKPVPDGELFAELGIFAMLPGLSPGHVLIATMEQGFFLLGADAEIRKLDHPEESFLRRAGIIHGIRLQDENLAFATLHEGVLIMEPDLGVDAVINQHAGLKVDDVKGVCQDLHGNIWCAMEHGIGKINYASPLSFYHENAGIEGTVNDVVKHRGMIHVATTQGLYRQKRSDAINLSLEFESLDAIRDQVWFLKVFGSSLMAGTANGLYHLTGDRIKRISEMNAFTACWLEQKNWLLVGGNNGMKAFGPPGIWKEQKSFDDITEDIKSIAVNGRSPYTEDEVWLGTAYQGAIKVLISPDGDHRISRYGTQDGLPGDWVLPMALSDTLVFGTRLGLLQFLDEKVIRESLPDSLKHDPKYYRGYFMNKELGGIGVIDPIHYLTVSGSNIWTVIDNEVGLIRQDTPGEILQKPFLGIDLGRINRIYQENDSTVWIAANEGLARYHMRGIDRKKQDTYTAIRKVLAAGDSLIFHGNHPLPADFSIDDPRVLFEQPGDRIPVLSYRLNDLTFIFSSPTYGDEDEQRFSWMLEGEDQDWSNWEKQRQVSYTRLREGEYAFHVRMRDVSGDVSRTATYRLQILPPWYRTGLAYLFYVILFALSLFLAVRLGQIRLRRKNERLEAIVEERTQEIRQQNIELARQKKEITDSIHYAEQIQRALLPEPKGIARHVSEYFILFQPKDIVSGDFYWLSVNGDKIIVTAADCTGHGVPGAFMSMLGISFLNKIILENNILHADMILNDLRTNVIRSLKQTGAEGESKDGMDMALVVIDMKEMYMEFAGANNPLYMIRDEEFNETKADRMPIGYYLHADEFGLHRIELKKGDCCYLFSDGYPDQFGGPRGKKFKYTHFKKLLLEHKDKSMEDQQKILEKTLEDWRAYEGPDGKPYEQVDDILVIGLRI